MKENLSVRRRSEMPWEGIHKFIIHKVEDNGSVFGRHTHSFDDVERGILG